MDFVGHNLKISFLSGIKKLAPLLKILGIDKKVGMLWLTAVIFGLLYGAAVIVDLAFIRFHSDDDDDGNIKVV